MCSMAENPIKNGPKKGDFATWWFKDNILHRVDGPAIDYFNGDEEWYYEGKLHRIDGPAYLSYNKKYKEWWFHGDLHRLDGPAIYFSDGQSEWWYRNKSIPCTSQEEFEKFLKLKAFI